MLLIANKPNLKKHARSLLGKNYSTEREKELIAACLKPLDRRIGFHRSHDEVAHLEPIDRILGNHGVEGFCEPCSVSYSNTGTTYAMTILYFDGKLRIGDWGSIVESLS